MDQNIADAWNLVVEEETEMAKPPVIFDEPAMILDQGLTSPFPEPSAPDLTLPVLDLGSGVDTWVQTPVPMHRLSLVPTPEEDGFEPDIMTIEPLVFDTCGK